MNDKYETLNEFRSRTGSFNQNSLPSGKSIETGAGLAKKVGSDGQLLDFIGNTVVFDLPLDVKFRIKAIQDKLYKECSDILAEPLNAESFHITLHDLVSGEPSDETDQYMTDVHDTAYEITDGIIKENKKIKMRSTFLFNMVNTSMVLGFEPADEESCSVIMEYYERLQEAVKLDYPLTPHVTLAYFKPGTINAEQVGKLQSVIDYAKSIECISTELSSDMLQYQLFFNMNDYCDFREIELMEKEERISRCPEAPVSSLEYISENGSIVIKRYTGSEQTVRIPELIDGLPVVSIAGGTFDGCVIRELMIPDGVVSIEDHAFTNSGVVYLTLPESISSIGENAFKNSRVEWLDVNGHSSPLNLKMLVSGTEILKLTKELSKGIEPNYLDILSEDEDPEIQDAVNKLKSMLEENYHPK